mmetsp:Transcript_9582/g.21186  ORF Transcript_9582/g.21186 Transcript_9582/m.21186 type:complete len:374 (-) Transcript_9582:178-1299(-)
MAALAQGSIGPPAPGQHKRPPPKQGPRGPRQVGHTSPVPDGATHVLQRSIGATVDGPAVICCSQAKIWLGEACERCRGGNQATPPAAPETKWTDLVQESEESSEEFPKDSKAKMIAGSGWLSKPPALKQLPGLPAAPARPTEASTPIASVTSSGHQAPGELDRAATSAASAASASHSVEGAGPASEDVQLAPPQASEDARPASPPGAQDTRPAPPETSEDARPAPPALPAPPAPPAPAANPIPAPAGGREPGAPRLCGHGKKVCNYEVVNNCQCTQQNMELYCHDGDCVEIKRQQRAEKRKTKSHTRPPLHIRRQKAAEQQAGSASAEAPPGLEPVLPQPHPQWQDPIWGEQWAPPYPQYQYYDPYSWGPWGY